MSKTCATCANWIKPDYREMGYCDILTEKLEWEIDDIATFDPTVEIMTPKDFGCIWYGGKKC